MKLNIGHAHEELQNALCNTVAWGERRRNRNKSSDVNFCGNRSLVRFVYEHMSRIDLTQSQR